MTSTTLPLYGGSRASSTNDFLPTRCPVGTFANEFSLTGGAYIQSIEFGCSDGSGTQSMLPGGGYSTFAPKISVPNGLTAMGVGSDGQSISSIGSLSAVPLTAAQNVIQVQSCPAGQLLVGYAGKYSDQVDGIQFICDYPAGYCVTNLESQFCQNNPPDVETLNQACSKNMTQTCRDRKQELHPSTVLGFCKNNASDPLCSCYNTVPSYIQSQYAGMPQCWNSTCGTQGYIPHPNQTCPPITICSNAIPEGGQNNVLTGTTQIVNCNMKDASPPALVPDGYGGDNNTPQPNPSSDGNGTFTPSGGGASGGSSGGNTQQVNVPLPPPPAAPTTSYVVPIIVIIFIILLVAIILFVMHKKRVSGGCPCENSNLNDDL